MNNNKVLSDDRDSAPIDFGAKHGKPSPLALTETQVAELVGCSLSRLRQDRHQARGLAYVKWGRSVRYLWEDVHKYLKNHRITHIQ